MSIITILLNLICPPLAVGLKHGLSGTLLVNVLLTMILWLPGVIHAFIVNK